MASYTNKIRYTGSSGIDVQSLVEQLMTAESAKKNKIYKQKTSLEWQQTALRGIGNNVKSFQNNFLSFTSSSSITNMRSASAYSTNSATITTGGSASSGITAKPAYDATTGTRNVEVIQTAQGEKRVSSSSVKGKIEGVTTIDYDGIKEGDNFDLSFNGTNVKVTFSAEEAAAIKNANASDKGSVLEGIVQQKLTDKFGKYGGEPKVQFKVENDKVSISSANGVGGTINFSGFNSSQNKTTVLSASDIPVDADGKFLENHTYKVKVGDTEMELKTFNDDGTAKTKDELVSELNSSLADKGVEGLAASIDTSGNMIFTSDYHTTDKEITVSRQNDILEFDQIRTSNLAGSVHKVDFGIPSYQSSTTLNKGQTLGEAFGSTGNIDFTINGKSFSFDASVTTIEDAMKQINNSGAGVKMEYDSTKGNFSIGSSGSGATAEIKFGGSADSFFSNFNIDVAGPATQVAQDAIVSINGEQSVFTTNSFTYDKVDYNITGAKAGTTYDVEVGTTSNNAFDNIKNFVNEYNKLIDELQTATTETRKKVGSYSFYEPLTDDEKSGMSESEITKYEAAAKTGILRNNEGLQKLTNKLRQAMNTPVTLEDGSKMYLYELGITTGEYSKGAKLEIDEAKLKNTLETRGGDVATLFTNMGTTVNGKTTNKGLMELVNDTITEAVGSNGYVSKYAGFENTILVNENTLSKKISKYESELAVLEKYLYNKENYYYKMFAAMEESVNASNSDMSYLSSFMGQ